ARSCECTFGQPATAERCGSGAENRSYPALRRPTQGWVGSLKTEEKTRTVDPRSRGGRILRPSTTFDRPTSAPTGNWFEPDRTNAGQRFERVLLRKEVIQPHLPVRLPCYDFTPITDP